MNDNAQNGGKQIPKDAQEMLMEHFATKVQGQREEILNAFLAKYGLEPDETVSQVLLGNRFSVMKWDAEEYAKARTAVMESTAASELVNLLKRVIVGASRMQRRNQIITALDGNAGQALDMIVRLMTPPPPESPPESAIMRP